MAERPTPLSNGNPLKRVLDALVDALLPQPALVPIPIPHDEAPR